jgi:hypothetical protein
LGTQCREQRLSQAARSLVFPAAGAQNLGILPLPIGHPTMPISITCPSCAKRHQAPDKLAGKSARCGCGTVIQVPPLATAGASSATSAFAAKPSGAWQSPAASQPTASLPAGSSVFDEISTADMNRGKRVAPTAAEAAPILQPGSSASPAAQVVGDVMSRVRNEMVEQERTHEEKLPFSVSVAMSGIAVPGVFALGGSFISFLMLGPEFIEDIGGAFLIPIFLMGGLFGLLMIGGAVALYMRAPFAIVYGYIAALMAVISGLCIVPNFFCGLLALWYLSMPETGEYLAKKGKLGVIEW